MSLKACTKCGLKKEITTTDGLCFTCAWEEQDEYNKRREINTSMPGGIIARWTTTPSFLDKKKNFRYFRIPIEQNLFFDSDKQYEIIVLEAKT